MPDGRDDEALVKEALVAMAAGQLDGPALTWLSVLSALRTGDLERQTETGWIVDLVYTRRLRDLGALFTMFVLRTIELSTREIDLKAIAVGPLSDVLRHPWEGDRRLLDELSRKGERIARAARLADSFNRESVMEASDEGVLARRRRCLRSRFGRGSTGPEGSLTTSLRQVRRSCGSGAQETFGVLCPWAEGRGSVRQLGDG